MLCTDMSHNAAPPTMHHWNYISAVTLISQVSRNDKHDMEGQNKSKFKFLTTNSETRRSTKPSYLYKLPKEQARAIFMARTRMIKVKTNYKNMYTNTICRGCGLKEETQQHVLEECTSIHTQDNLITPTNQIFSNDPTNKLTLIKTIYGWEQA